VNKKIKSMEALTKEFESEKKSVLV